MEKEEIGVAWRRQNRLQDGSEVNPGSGVCREFGGKEGKGKALLRVTHMQIVNGKELLGLERGPVGRAVLEC